MFFSHVFSHALASAITLAAAAKPSLTNPFALLVAVGGVAMAVAMVIAAGSFRRLEHEHRGPARAKAVADRATARAVPDRAAAPTSSRATREAKTMV